MVVVVVGGGIEDNMVIKESMSVSCHRLIWMPPSTTRPSPCFMRGGRRGGGREDEAVDEEGTAGVTDATSTSQVGPMEEQVMDN